MHLKSSKTRGDVTLRSYQHDRRGIVEILTRGSVVVLRPVFGLVKQASPPDTAKAKRGSRLGRMWQQRKEARP